MQWVGNLLVFSVVVVFMPRLSRLFYLHLNASNNATAARSLLGAGLIRPTHAFGRFISDLEGLLGYLHQKVRWGKCCLYCPRMFRDVASCQQHMGDLGHAKVAYETEDEISEVVDFYDFSEVSEC
jgi:pre-60S factor REI1